MHYLFGEGIIRLRVLSSSKLFSELYDIHEELLLKVCDGEQNLLLNPRVAKADSMNLNYMTMEEQINLMCAKCAEDTSNSNAMEEYEKKRVYFGYL